MRIGYLECRSGVSGDMMLGLLVDLGVPVELLEQTVHDLDVGAELRVHRVQRSGIAACKVDVPLHSSHSHNDGHHHDHHGHNHLAHGRTYEDIRQLIEARPLSPEARRLAQQAFLLLGQAEAKIHNIPLAEVHFHEVGSADAIVDIVCSAVGLTWLEVDQWHCSPLNVGGGSVVCAHGTFPVPAPATLELLKGAPIYSEGPLKELVTPTGAAIVAALGVQFGRFPAMLPERVGYGAGSQDFPAFPNVVRASLGLGQGAAQTSSEPVTVLEASIDDATPELLAFACERLLELGALDVYQSPIVMKKARAATLLTVICQPALTAAAELLLLRQTTTLGVRRREQTRTVLERGFETAQTEWGPVPIKVARWTDGEQLNAAPEYEACKQIALEHGVPLKRVLERALECYRAAR